MCGVILSAIFHVKNKYSICRMKKYFVCAQESKQEASEILGMRMLGENT